MTRKTGTTRKARRDLDQEITDLVIAKLEDGTVPWAKPWTTAYGDLPTSVATGRPYRGINLWLTSIAAAANGYTSPLWMTYRQAEERRGHVRKGEHGTTVVFFRSWNVADPTDADPDHRKDVWVMRNYTVFNLEQTEDVQLPPRFTREAEDREPVEVDEAVTAILEGYADGPQVRHVRGDRAYYEPARDVITLPELDQFKTAEGFASTALHEITHSTGHSSRLDRFALNGEPQHFGSERYAREELVAEMGAAILATTAGVDLDLNQTAAYVASWLGALRDDKTLVVKAAQQAQRAVDRVLGNQPQDTTTDTEGEAA